MSYFRNKVFAISGGASGIGRATAHLLASKGARVSIADINGPMLRGTKALIDKEAPQTGSECITFRSDIRDKGLADEWITKTVAKWGKLDGAANFAGIMNSPSLKSHITQLEEEDWNTVLETNLTGTMICLAAQIPHMKNETGAIVNISSVMGQTGWAFAADYCASKAGVISLTKCAAKEVAHRGVRVNAIAPGPIDTPLIAKDEKSYEAIIQGPWNKVVPLGRKGTPEEMAYLCEFLLGDKSTYMTGAIVNADGGLSIASS